MKNTKSQLPNKNTKFEAHKPEIRDNLDSRKSEEQDFKGNDVTHNTKDHHHESKKKNK